MVLLLRFELCWDYLDIAFLPNIATVDARGLDGECYYHNLQLTR